MQGTFFVNNLFYKLLSITFAIVNGIYEKTKL